jgi:hypothetical protein
MCCEFWELGSWIATVIASALGVLGLAFVIWQLYLQRQQSRLEFLNRLYAEFDTPEARSARRHIYSQPPAMLRLEYLHAEGKEAERQMVEDTLAMLERAAYPIINHHVPSKDAFNVYAGVLLSLAHQLWPYVEEQRTLRRQSGLRHRLGYRKFLEAVVREWAPKYAREANLELSDASLSTSALLDALFPGAPK